MEVRAKKALARACRRFVARRDLKRRIARLQALLFDKSRSVIARMIIRKVRMMRAQKSGASASAAQALAAMAAPPLHAWEAAVRVQARFRSVDARARSKPLYYAREAIRPIRVEIHKARGLRAADARCLTADHRFQAESSDPLCFLAAALGERGGYGPKDAGPAEGAAARIRDDYALVEQRRVTNAYGKSAHHNESEGKRAYLDALEAKLRPEKLAEDLSRRRELAAQSAELGGMLDRALIAKMKRNVAPFWMPPVVKGRDWPKFTAYPAPRVGIPALIVPSRGRAKDHRRRASSRRARR